MMIYIPNILTLIRIGLVPVFLVLLQDQQFFWSLYVFLVAGISDGLDGFIAKRFNAQTKLGTLLDPLADKALLVSAYIMLSVMQLIPFWLMVVVVFRDLVIVGGYLLFVLFFSTVKMAPIRVSKLNTFLQIVFILCVLVSLSWKLDITMMLNILSYAVLVTGVMSGFIYVWVWSIKAMNLSESKESDVR